MIDIDNIKLFIISNFPNLVIKESDVGLFDDISSGAVFCGKYPKPDYRYLLWRIFDKQKPILFVLMLNPSKATHDENDRTIAGLIKRAQKMGFGGICVMNCFAFMATSPQDMKNAKDPIGPSNDHFLDMMLGFEIPLLCAWGTNASFRDRDREIKCKIMNGKAKPYILRLCADGSPEHPLYVPQKIELSPWSINILNR